MFQAIMHNMLHFFHMYAGAGSGIGFLVFVLALVPVIKHARTQKESLWRNRHALVGAAVFACLAMYLYIAVGITLLSRREGYSAIINVRVFSTFSGSFTDRMYVYENILLFLPLGILLFILAKPFRNPFVSFLTGAAASLAIETMQALTRRGSFEVDDLLTNTLGMMIGYCACRLPLLLYQRCKSDRMNKVRSSL